jgi:hypothetical protein
MDAVVRGRVTFTSVNSPGCVSTSNRHAASQLESSGHGVANCQRGELFFMAGEKWTAGDHKAACPQLD